MVINRIESARETQSEIDNAYENLCDVIFTEMNNMIPCFDTSRRTKRSFKASKPYLNNELSGLWNTMHSKEKLFLQFNGRPCIKRQLRQNFRHLIRNCVNVKGCSNHHSVKNWKILLPKVRTHFWKKNKKLGPHKSNLIPVEAYDENGEILTDETFILEKWKSEFEKLYNNEGSDEFDTDFHRQCLSHKHLLEDRMLDPLYESNGELNYNVSLEEIDRIIMNSKNGKSTGIDKIPYEVLKFPAVVPVIRALFQLIFDPCIVPSKWRKAIIYPILKDPSSARRVPLNHRGISLLLCISKLYSAFINGRLIIYLGSNNLLSEEQNGFRLNRSCEDHVFTPNSIIRNNTNIFASFIDLK